MIIYVQFIVIVNKYQIIIKNNTIVVIVIILDVFNNVNINIIIMMDQNIDVLQIEIVTGEHLKDLLLNVLIHMSV